MEIILIITTLLMACVVTIGWVFVSLRGSSPIPGGSQPLRRFPPPPCPPPKKSIEPLDGETRAEFVVRREIARHRKEIKRLEREKRETVIAIRFHSDTRWKLAEYLRKIVRERKETE